MVDNPTLNEWMDLLEPDLIVLQYGLNIVRNIGKVSYYQRGIVRQLDVIKRRFPGVPVLIIRLPIWRNRRDSIKPFDNIGKLLPPNSRAGNLCGFLECREDGRFRFCPCLGRRGLCRRISRILLMRVPIPWPP